MAERGATEAEVRATVEHGEQYPVRFGRSGFRRNFAFEEEWRVLPNEVTRSYRSRRRWRVARLNGYCAVFLNRRETK